MKKIILFLFISLCLCGCGEKKPFYKELMENGEYIILDVRTKEEYENGHIKNAINISYEQINKEVDLDKEKTIFVYCKSGNRSKIAYTTLKDLGYTVYDLGAFDSLDLEKE